MSPLRLACPLLALLLAGILAGSSVLGLAQAGTRVNLRIFGATGLIIPEYVITPPTVNKDDTSLVASARPLLYATGAVATAIPCRLVFDTPGGQALTLTSRTDASGVCAYDMSRDLASQDLVVTTGQVATLTATPGNGSGYIEYTFEGVTYPTNTDTYSVVNPLVPQIPPLVVTPPEVYPGDPVVITLPPVDFDNDTAAVGLSCRLEITTPESAVVVISGPTDATGSLQYDAARSLAEQGLTLVSGDLDALTRTLGQGSASATCTYDGREYPTPDPTTYLVIPRPQSLDIPQFEITPESIDPDEELVFAAEPLRFTDGSVGVDIPCTLTILTPATTTVVLDSRTDAAGVCAYTTDSGDWTLTSGSPADIRTPGAGSAYITYTYANTAAQTNVDTYTVVSPDPVLAPITFEIDPERVELGEPVTYRLNSVRDTEDNILAGLPCTLNLAAPDLTRVVITGATDTAGECVYEAPDQTIVSRLRRIISLPASAATAVDSGNPLTLNGSEGTGTGFAEVQFQGATALTDVDTYEVVAQLLEEDDPDSPDNPISFPGVVETIRTGGALSYGILALFVVFLISLYQTLRPFWSRDSSQ